MATNNNKPTKEKKHITSSQAGVKVAQFFKKNIYVILMLVCILAIATMITVAVVANNDDEPTINPIESGDINSGDNDQNVDGDNDDDNDNDDNDDDDDDNTGGDTDQEQEFVMADPMDEYTLGQGFSDTQLVFDPTHGHWATHEGIDFMAPAGSEVKCVFDGKVEEVTTDSYNGTVVRISHILGYETVYKLLDNVSLKAGDTIKKGDVIGTVSDSALAEVASGAHLHFELYKDGSRINPMDFMLGGDK